MIYDGEIESMAKSFITLEAASTSEEMKDAIEQIKSGKKCILDAKKYKIEHNKSKATSLGHQGITYYKQALTFAKNIPDDNVAEFIAACYTKKEISALLKRDPKGATRQTIISLIKSSILEAKVLLFPLKID